jgi:alkylation response protein AidB-like acyl-CoA dehydrogenase
MLSELAMLVDVLEGYLYDIADHVKFDQAFDRKKTRFGTIFSRDCVIRAIVLGLDILASAGTMRDHPMEKLVRDGLTLLHGGGTNSLLKVRIVPWLT